MIYSYLVPPECDVARRLQSRCQIVFSSLHPQSAAAHSHMPIGRKDCQVTSLTERTYKSEPGQYKIRSMLFRSAKRRAQEIANGSPRQQPYLLAEAVCLLAMKCRSQDPEVSWCSPGTRPARKGPDRVEHKPASAPPCGTQKKSQLPFLRCTSLC